MWESALISFLSLQLFAVAALGHNAQSRQSSSSSHASDSARIITSGQRWKDTSGADIEAHGGSIWLDDAAKQCVHDPFSFPVCDDCMRIQSTSVVMPNCLPTALQRLNARFVSCALALDDASSLHTLVVFVLAFYKLSAHRHVRASCSRYRWVGATRKASPPILPNEGVNM